MVVVYRLGPPPSPTAGMENVEMFAHTSRKSVLFYQPQSIALQDQRYPASFLFKQANSGKISISWGLFTSSPVCSTNSGLPAEKGGGGKALPNACWNRETLGPTANSTERVKKVCVHSTGVFLYGGARR